MYYQESGVAHGSYRGSDNYTEPGGLLSPPPPRAQAVDSASIYTPPVPSDLTPTPPSPSSSSVTSINVKTVDNNSSWISPPPPATTTATATVTVTSVFHEHQHLQQPQDRLSHQPHHHHHQIGHIQPIPPIPEASPSGYNYPQQQQQQPPPATISDTNTINYSGYHHQHQVVSGYLDNRVTPGQQIEPPMYRDVIDMDQHWRNTSNNSSNSNGSRHHNGSNVTPHESTSNLRNSRQLEGDRFRSNSNMLDFSSSINQHQHHSPQHSHLHHQPHPHPPQQQQQQQQQHINQVLSHSPLNLTPASDNSEDAAFRRKRGRPAGSKNKPKTPVNLEPPNVKDYIKQLNPNSDAPSPVKRRASSSIVTRTSVTPSSPDKGGGGDIAATTTASPNPSSNTNKSSPRSILAKRGGGRGRRKQILPRISSQPSRLSASPAIPSSPPHPLSSPSSSPQTSPTVFKQKRKYTRRTPKLQQLLQQPLSQQHQHQKQQVQPSSPYHQSSQQSSPTKSQSSPTKSHLSPTKSPSKPQSSPTKSQPSPIKSQSSPTKPQSQSLPPTDPEKVRRKPGPKPGQPKKRKMENVAVNTTLSVDAHSGEELTISSSFPFGSLSNSISANHSMTSQHGSSSVSNNKKKKVTGPYVRVEKAKGGTKVTYSIVNATKKIDEDKEGGKKGSGAHSRNLFNTGHNREGFDHHRPNSSMNMSSFASKRKHSSTPTADSILKDNTWICIFCQQRPHYRGMGDLFGPYYIPVETKIQQLNQSNQLAANGDYKMDDGTKQEGGGSTSDSQLRSRLTYEKRRHPDGSSGDSSDSKRRLVENCNNLEIISTSSTPINKNNSGSNQTTSQREVWFHEDCLVWSNGVYLVGHRIRNIEEVIKDCYENICCECKLKGAPLGCLHKGCAPRYHYLCAKEKGCDMDEENFSIHCPKHKKKTRPSL